MKTQDYIISTRFMLTLGHFTALLILFGTISSNIHISMTDQAATKDRESAASYSYVRSPFIIEMRNNFLMIITYFSLPSFLA